MLRTLKMDDLVRNFNGMESIYCDCMKEGDVYYTGGPFGTEIPKNFCPNAWEAIGVDAAVLASGGVVNNVERYRHIGCCNDGLRPVIFLLEPCEDDLGGACRSRRTSSGASA